MNLYAAEARRRGLKHYFTGLPCKRGHIAERFTSTRNCVECNKLRGRNLSDEQKEKRNKRSREYANRNPEKVTENWNKWAKENPRKVSANSRFMYLKRRKRVPVWVRNTEKSRILEFYKNCPDGFEVDHIIPLNGRNVSGLHILSNLQYLPISENRKKGNNW